MYTQLPIPATVTSTNMPTTIKIIFMIGLDFAGAAGVGAACAATGADGAAGAEFSFGSKGGISSQEYLTPDPVEKVVEFYKGKYGDQLSVIESEGHYRLALGERGGEQVTTIDISADEETGKTKIFIAHIGKGMVQ